MCKHCWCRKKSLNTDPIVAQFIFIAEVLSILFNMDVVWFQLGINTFDNLLITHFSLVYFRWTSA